MGCFRQGSLVASKQLGGVVLACCGGLFHLNGGPFHFVALLVALAANGEGGWQGGVREDAGEHWMHYQSRCLWERGQCTTEDTRGDIQTPR